MKKAAAADDAKKLKKRVRELEQKQEDDRRKRVEHARRAGQATFAKYGSKFYKKNAKKAWGPDGALRKMWAKLKAPVRDA